MTKLAQYNFSRKVSLNYTKPKNFNLFDLRQLPAAWTEAPVKTAQKRISSMQTPLTSTTTHLYSLPQMFLRHPVLLHQNLPLRLF